MEKGEERLFDYLVVVALAPEGGSTGTALKGRPFLKYRYPPPVPGTKANSEPFIKDIADFCFPDAQELIAPPSDTNSAQNAAQTTNTAATVDTFSFVLTEVSGDKRWAYCRRLLRGPRSHCFCIVSFNPCFSVFSPLLDEVIQKAYNGEVGLECIDFIEAVYNHSLPQPGATLVVRVPIRPPKNAAPAPAAEKEYRFTRPDDSDSLLGHVDFEPLLLLLSPMNIVALFASLLVERRVIFIANKLATLSSCIQAAVAMLYPLSWQHIFVPVLPPSLLSFCCAPMPFVVGVLRSSVPVLQNMPGMEAEIVVVDIDRNTVTSPETLQDRQRLPQKQVEELLVSLQGLSKEVKSKYSGFSLFKRSGGNQGSGRRTGAPAEREKDYIAKDLSNSFIAFMVDLLRAYRGSITTQGDRISFNREGYILSHQPEFRPLVTEVVQTQMFEMFIQDRATRHKEGAFEEGIKVAKEKKALSRFTMYDNGEISRGDITKKVREMLREANEKENEANRNSQAGQKRGWGEFWNQMWKAEEEAPEIAISAPNTASFRKITDNPGTRKNELAMLQQDLNPYSSTGTTYRPVAVSEAPADDPAPGQIKHISAPDPASFRRNTVDIAAMLRQAQETGGPGTVASFSPPQSREKPPIPPPLRSSGNNESQEPGWVVTVPAKRPSWTSASVQTHPPAEINDSALRPFCNDAEVCISEEPQHWITFQHPTKIHEGQLTKIPDPRRGFLANWWDYPRPVHLVLTGSDLFFFKDKNDPNPISRLELRQVKTATWHVNNHPIAKRDNCLELDTRSGAEKSDGDAIYLLGAASTSEGEAWLADLRKLGVPCKTT